MVGRVITINTMDDQQKENEMVSVAINDINIQVDSGCKKILLPEKTFRKVRKDM